MLPMAALSSGWGREACTQIGPAIVCLCSQVFHVVLSVWFVVF